MKKTKIIGEDSTPSIKISRNRGSGKKHADLFERFRNTEHPLDNIFPEPATEPIQPVQPSPSDSVHPLPTAPVKDFQRVPNSITRDAVPNKFFKGTSKSTYDALYLKTRGAVNPIRTIKATKRELMKWIGISHVTIFKHLKHLESVGLLQIEQHSGSHDGSVYEVFIPEEVEPILTHTNPSYPILSYPILSNTIPYNKVVSLPYNNVVLDRMGNPVENKELNTPSNTSLNTNTNDDEAFADFIGKFNEKSRQLTGKKLSNRDAEALGKLADLLILQLEIAEKKTSNISSFAPFLVEVCRRNFLNVAPAKQTKIKSDTIGKPEPETYEIKLLDQKGREAALVQLREFANDEFLQDFEKWYTAEDWNWLTEQLKEK